MDQQDARESACHRIEAYSDESSDPNRIFATRMEDSMSEVDTEELCQRAEEVVEVKNLAQVRVKPKWVVWRDEGFVPAIQVRMVEEFESGVEGVFDMVHGRRRGGLDGLVSRVGTDSTASANGQCMELIQTLLQWLAFEFAFTLECF